MKPTVLSSRLLTDSQVQLLHNSAIYFVEYQALKIDLLKPDVPKKLTYAIITSQHTVDFVLQQHIKIEQCFCVGEKTAKRLEKNHYKVIENTHYGRDLAKIIAQKHGNKEFVFLCGNRRRPEMPKILTENHIAYTEIQVYENKFNPKKFQQNFDGIMFFSPSQIKSYLLANELKQQTAFCIGTTTAAEAQKHTNQIIIANKPTVENVIVQVIKTFKND